MIAALLAAAQVAAAGPASHAKAALPALAIDRVGTPVSGSYIPLNAEARLRLAYPPCGTPEALKAKSCIKWIADPDDPQAIGYVPSVVQIGLPDSRP